MPLKKIFVYDTEPRDYHQKIQKKNLAHKNEQNHCIVANYCVHKRRMKKINRI